MKLSYRQLEAILAAYLNVHPDKVGTFRSRLKQLQRLEFPQGVNIGRGVRMSYSAEHLLQLAAAFEIIGAGLAAKAATDLVTTHWPKFQAAFGRASARLALGDDYQTFVCVRGRGPVSVDERSQEDVSVHDLTSLTEQVLSEPRSEQPGRAGVLIIRADYLFARVNRLAGDVGQAVHARWSPEYRVWSEARDKNQQHWDEADGGSPIPF